MKFTLIEKKAAYQGFFRMDVCTVRHDRFDGGQIEVVRENMERGDAVAVLLHDPERDQVLLIEQFRIGAALRSEVPRDAWLIEIVAGMIDGDETPESCARRECIEEAGYKPQALRPLGSFFVSPGGCSERLILYIAEVSADHPCAEGGGVDAEHEDIRLQWVGREQALAWVYSGRIRSAAPMLALLLAFHPRVDMK